MQTLADIAKAVSGRDVVAIAIDTFKHLETLRPVDISQHLYLTHEEQKERAELSKKYLPMPERTEHQRLLDRSDAHDENARRLRSTMWAEVTLRGTKHADYAAILATFHREMWRVARVHSDSAEREKQIADAIKMQSRGAR